jgi:hypothetical protein
LSNPQITIYPRRTTIEVTQRETQILQVIAQGPAGVNGVSGVTGYQHTQTTLSNAWTINHKLGRKPSITVIYNDTSIEGTPIHNSDDVAVVTFAIAISGSAYCI